MSKKRGIEATASPMALFQGGDGGVGMNTAPHLQASSGPGKSLEGWHRQLFGRGELRMHWLNGAVIAGSELWLGALFNLYH